MALLDLENSPRDEVPPRCVLQKKRFCASQSWIPGQRARRAASQAHEAVIAFIDATIHIDMVGVLVIRLPKIVDTERGLRGYLLGK
jgi:hypothetical protein